jgi:hypothetical protein
MNPGPRIRNIGVLFFSGFQDALNFKDNKSLRNHKTAEIKVIHNFLLIDGRIQIWIRTSNYESVSGRPKNLRVLLVRIRNTGATATTI